MKRNLYAAAVWLGVKTAQIAAFLVGYKQIDNLLTAGCKAWVRSKYLLRIRNAYRVKFCQILSERKCVLIGLVNDDIFPNFHTVDLLRDANVISLTTKKEWFQCPDRIVVDLVGSVFNDVIGLLPDGCNPELFFDPKIGGRSMPVKGLEKAPFLTVATIGHNSKSLEIENFVELYDVVLPLSRTLAELYAQRFPQKIMGSVPLGLNWGAFSSRINEEYYARKIRPIDVFLSFGESAAPQFNGVRTMVYKLVCSFAKRYEGVYNVVIKEGMLYQDYLDLLSRSKIAINVVGFASACNYRLFEAISAGAVVMQYDMVFEFGRPGLEEFFSLGDEVFLFDDSDFEDKLIYLLENSDLLEQARSSAYGRMKQCYSYAKLYAKLFGDLVVFGCEDVLGGRLSVSESAACYVAGMYHSPDSNKKRVAAKILFRQDYGGDDSLRARLVLAFLPFVDEVSGLMSDICSFYDKVKASDPKTVCLDAFREVIDPSIIDRWNYFVCMLTTSRSEMQSLQCETLECLALGACDRVSKTDLFAVPINIPGVTPPLYGEIRHHWLAERLLMCDNDKCIDACIKSFMSDALKCLILQN